MISHATKHTDSRIVTAIFKYSESEFSFTILIPKDFVLSLILGARTTVG